MIEGVALMSRDSESRTSASAAASARDDRACSATPRPSGPCSMPTARPHAACLADRRTAPASARRRWHIAWRGSFSRIPIRAAAVRGRGLARARPEHPVARQVAGAGASRPARAGAHRERQTACCAPSSRSSRCAPHGVVLRLDRGRGRLARLHRRLGRRAAIPARRQQAAEDPGGAARARALPAGQPCARPAACRPSARAAGGSMLRPLTPAEVAQAVAAATGAEPAGCRDRDGRGAARWQRRPRPHAARGRNAGVAPAGDGAARGACRRPTRGRCMRSATRSAAPTPARSRRSSTRSRWLSARLDERARKDARRLARLAEAWEQVNRGCARGRRVQSRPQAAGFRGVRLACRGGAGLIPNTWIRHGRACPGLFESTRGAAERRTRIHNHRQPGARGYDSALASLGRNDENT